jgi:hypothetical protein
MKGPLNYPQIGLDSAGLHLADVLYPAYRRFEEAQTRANALAVALAAWNLHERLWHDKGCKPALDQFRANLFSACPELELMRDLAETGKHAGLNRDVKLVSITGAENPGGTLVINDGPVGPEGPFRGNLTTVPTCTLTMNYTDGKTYSVPDVLKKVVGFWSKELT